jgi:hypothetical protein
MKIFIGQRVRGADPGKLKEESIDVAEKLKTLGHEVDCTFLEDTDFSKMNSGEKLKHAFDILDNCDTFLAIVRDEEKSEGLLIEIGYALAKKMRIIVFVNENVGRTTLREIANDVVEFKDKEDMLNKIKELE